VEVYGENMPTSSVRAGERYFPKEVTMEEGFTFITDKQARIISWGKQIGDFMGKQAPETLGKVYHEVFPKLVADNADAVSSALTKNSKVVLRAYPLTCPHHSIMADIVIEPQQERNRKTARVAISNVTCPVLQRIGTAQRFVDIGMTASTLAHGVRNPLNAMKGAALYLSQKYPDEPTLAEFARIMEEEIVRFDKFISRFLSTSMPLSSDESVLTDINEMLKKIRVLTSFQTNLHNIQTVYEYGDIPALVVNSFHLEHAILNIINNAIESMDSGGKLTVKSAVEKHSAGDYVMVTISDTGTGLSGRGVSKSRLLETSGKGFGLLITRGILAYYGGHLEIQNRKGSKGTVARLFFPATRKTGGSE
jgi:two-component system nitrogen regulation sensor histidine kinase GlnL